MSNQSPAGWTTVPAYWLDLAQVLTKTKPSEHEHSPKVLKWLPDQYRMDFKGLLPVLKPQRDHNSDLLLEYEPYSFYAQQK